MVNVILTGGSSVNLPGNTDDTVTAKGDKKFYIYNVITNDGNDKIDLTKAFETSFYRVYAGAGNDTITGSGGTFYDGSGNDIIHATKSVLIYAGAGDDLYDGGTQAQSSFLDSDTVSFNFQPSEASGFELNTQDMNVNLALKTAQNLGIFGSDTLISIENLVGGAGNDTFIGSSAANQLDGNGGNDTLRGLKGNDTLNGGAGEDLLFGGKGSDRFDLADSLGAARDIVKYTSKGDAGVYSTKQFATKVWDIITNFDKGAEATADRIDLSAIDTSKAAGDQAFKFIGSAAFHANANWEVRVSKIKVDSFSSTKSTLIQIDTDNDTAAEFSIIVENVTGLKAFDFIL